MTDVPLISVRNVGKVYRLGGQDLHALKGISLDIRRGQYVSIMGPSGSGKSTLFNLIGGLDRPTTGDVLIEGYHLAELTPDQLAWFRCHKIGFIFQTFNLVTAMSALENVMVARLFAGISVRQARRDAAEMLERLGLGHRLHHRPGQVSGGQQQRIAIARALVNKPLIILADEPTGNLDLHTGQEVIELLSELKRELGITIITATHDMKMISASDTLVRIRGGAIEAVLSQAELQVTVGTIDGMTVM